MISSSWRIFNLITGWVGVGYIFSALGPWPIYIPLGTLLVFSLVVSSCPFFVSPGKSGHLEHRYSLSSSNSSFILGRWDLGIR